MEIGLGLLGHAPQAFWNMTPREIEAALRGLFAPLASPAPPTRREVAALMQRYPDRQGS